jgi:hypothetical protein
MTPRIVCLIAAAVFSLIALGHALPGLPGKHPGKQVVDEATARASGQRHFLPRNENRSSATGGSSPSALVH